jgi:hypothetical protein
LSSETIFGGAAQHVIVPLSRFSQAQHEAFPRPAHIHNDSRLNLRTPMHRDETSVSSPVIPAFFTFVTHPFGKTVRPEERSTYSNGASFAD